MHAGPRSEKNQRMANIIAVADVGQLEAAQRAEFFLQGEKIRERLARMEFIGERVNDRNLRVSRHFLQHALFVNARDDAVHPTLEVAPDVGNGSPLASPPLRLIYAPYKPAHALRPA